MLLAKQVSLTKAIAVESPRLKRWFVSWKAPSGKSWPVLQLTKEKHGQILKKCQAKIVSAEQQVGGLTSACFLWTHTA